MQVLGLDPAQPWKILGEKARRRQGDRRRKLDRDEQPHAGTVPALEAGGPHLVTDEEREECDGKRDRDRPQGDDTSGFALLDPREGCRHKLCHRL